MGIIRFWYSEGKIIELASSANLLLRFQLDFGNGLHITWRTSGTRIPFFNEQYKLLQEILEKNKFQPDSLFDEQNLKKEISSLLNRNRVFKGALLHLFCLPSKEIINTKSCSLHMAVENYSEEKFLLNSRGLRIGQLMEPSRQDGWFLPRLGDNHPLHHFWKQELKEKRWDAGYFTGANGSILECPDACLFVIQGTRIFTPSSKSGLTPRAIRNVILRLAPTLGLEMQETDELKPVHLSAADEIFIASDLNGIRWVAGHGEQRFYRKYSELFNTIINREWSETD